MAVEKGKLVSAGKKPVIYSLPEDQSSITRVEVPNPQGGPPIVVSTNTGFGGGLHIEDPADWLEEVTEVVFTMLKAIDQFVSTKTGGVNRSMQWTGDNATEPWCLARKTLDMCRGLQEHMD